MSLSSIVLEKKAIVIDIGTRYIKCGVSEESSPRCILRWEVVEMLKKRPTAKEWHKYLYDQLHTILFQHLHINPIRRRFVICEDLLLPSLFRESFVNVVFEMFKASSIALVPTMFMALYSTYNHTALIIDTGYRETRFLPVYKGIPLLHYYTATSIGTASCCDFIQNYPNMKNVKNNNTQLSTIEAEEILERVCVIQQCDPLPNVADCDVPWLSTVCPSALRTAAVEHFFTSDSDSESDSIVEAIAKIIEKLPVDIRRAMLANIVCIGGNAMLPGFTNRLRDELQRVVKSSKISSIQDPIDSTSSEPTPTKMDACIIRTLFPCNIMSWIGTSIYAATEQSKKGRGSISASSMSQLTNNSTFNNSCVFDNSCVNVIESVEYFTKREKGEQLLPDWLSITKNE